jgi:hypothetical protein
VTADSNTFANDGGELHLHIIDAQGDEKKIKTKVMPLLAQLKHLAEAEAESEW